jgi:hypothetical protein
MRPSCSNRALTPVIRLLLATLVLVQYLGTASAAQTIYAAGSESFSASYNGYIVGLVNGTYYDDGGYGLSPATCSALPNLFGISCAFSSLPANITVTGTISYTVTVQPFQGSPFTETVTTTGTVNTPIGSAPFSQSDSFGTTACCYFIPAPGNVQTGAPETANPNFYGGVSAESANPSFVPPQNTNYSGTVQFVYGSVALNQPQKPLSNGSNMLDLPNTLVTGQLTSGSGTYASGVCSIPTSPPTVQDLITLGNQSWGTNPSGFKQYTVLDNLTAVKSEDGATQVTAYVSGDKNNCGQIVIAAAGDIAGPRASGFAKANLLADQSFVTGLPTSALTNAVQKEADIVQYAASQYPTAQITLTGVSEGGGISEIVGKFASVQTVTFIAPGSGKLLPLFNGNLTLVGLGAIQIRTPANQIINYRIYGDQLSLIGQPIGEQITVVPDTATGCPAYALGACALQQAIDSLDTITGGLGLFLPQNLPVLFNLIHNGELLAQALGPAPQIPGVMGAWNASWVTWYEVLTTIFCKEDVFASAHFYETLDPGPNYANNLLPFLDSLVQAFNTIHTQNVDLTQITTVQLFNAAVSGGTTVLVDPPPGYLFSLSQSLGSPNMSSIVLPTADVAGGDDVGWHLTYRTQNGLSGTLTSYTGEFDFPSGVNSIDFYAIDPSGNAIAFNDSLLFAATFGNSGQFDATLTTYLTPVTNLPLASGQSCNGTFNGSFRGNVIVSAGQSCTFVNDCQIAGSLTVTGGSLFLACPVTGSVAELGGDLFLAPSASVGGNLQISKASAFTVGPGALVGGNFQIQSLSSGLPQATVCGTQVNGNLQVQNDASPVKIGGIPQQGCAGNTIGGNLLVDANTAAVSIDYNTIAGALHIDNDSATTDVSGNSVGKDLECQNDNSVTYIAPNMVTGQNHGQCAALP